MSRTTQAQAVHVECIQANQLDCIQLPLHVKSEILKRAVDVALQYNTHEGKPTGCILILGDPELQADCVRMALEPRSLAKNRVSILHGEVEGALREAFSDDGAILISGYDGVVVDTRLTFFPEPCCSLIMEGHGTRHHQSLHVAASKSCVVVTRSQDGYVTVFSSEHLHCDHRKAFRVEGGDGRGPHRDRVIMTRTPLVSFESAKGGAGKMGLSQTALKRLRKLPPPLRVAAFVGPGRTGKSTLAGQVAGDRSLFPTAKTPAAVTPGINAAAIEHPEEGTLLLLDCEGFDNPLAPSRTEIATLCFCICSMIVSVEYDRLDDRQLQSLARLSAYREVLFPRNCEAAGEVHSDSTDLVLVVNGSRFHSSDYYGPQALEEVLSADDGNMERRGNLEAVRRHFPRRAFISIPTMDAADYANCVVKLQKMVFGSSPLTFAIDGHMLCKFLIRTINDINAGGSIHRETYIAQFLKIIKCNAWKSCCGSSSGSCRCMLSIVLTSALTRRVPCNVLTTRTSQKS